MTGKLADTVMSVRNGEQIARKYQPVVYNPSTPAQIAQRSKMKLLSQVSAVFATVIAMRKNGAVSTRNLFVKENFGSVTYTSNKADIQLASLKLTKSTLGLSPITATRSGLNVEAALEIGQAGLSRVVYVAVVRQQDNTIRVAATSVVSEAGDNNDYQTTLNINTSYPVVVYAYGVRDNTEAARVKFSDMMVTAESVAEVVASRMLTETDITLTETRSKVVATQGA